MDNLIKKSAFFYKQKTLALFYWVRTIIVIAFGLGVFLGLYMSYMDLIAVTSISVVSLIVLPYTVIGVLLSIICLFIQKSKYIPWVILLFCFPLFVLTPSGISSLIFYALLLMVNWIEKSQRKKAVELVSFFSEEYSPMYQERKSKQLTEKEARFAYKVLPLINVSEYNLIKETKVTTKYKLSGITEIYLMRTFAIKGIPKTTVRDSLTSVKLSKWQELTMLQLPLLKRR